MTIKSGGTLGIGGIEAPGASVNLTASGTISVSGGIDSAGDASIPLTGPTQAQSAGPISIASTGGDVWVDGELNATGLSATGRGIGGGNGGPVSITAGNVTTGAIDTGGGASTSGTAGSSAPITVAASGALQTLGQLDGAGHSGGSGGGAPGAKISLTATGGLTVGGELLDGGGQSAAGGTVVLSGASVSSDDLDAPGGEGSNGSPGSSGGSGGSITVTAVNGATLGSLLASGGGAGRGHTPGSGGSVSLTSTSGSISAGSVQTQGGSDASGAGVAGGPVSLLANDDLDVDGVLSTSGSDAGGVSEPPYGGGNAGDLTLQAATGTLNLEGRASASGGAGGAAPTGNGYGLGGTGGAGGSVVIVAHAISALASLSSRGGDGGGQGALQGPGGTGGAISAYTDSPLFDAKQVVDSTGGDGNPTGKGGQQNQDQAPTGLQIDATTGILGFTSNSPDAQGYHLLESIAGATPITALTTTATSGLTPTVALCVPVSFTVIAFNSSVGWTSDPSNAVSYERQPSVTQTCAQAPVITPPALIVRSVPELRRAHWVASVAISSSGIGALTGTLRFDRKLPKVSKKPAKHHGKPKKHKPAPRKKKPATVQVSAVQVLSTQLTRPGATVLQFVVPPADRAPGIYSLALTSTSPDGKSHAGAALNLELEP